MGNLPPPSLPSLPSLPDLPPCLYCAKNLPLHGSLSSPKDNIQSGPGRRAQALSFGSLLTSWAQQMGVLRNVRAPVSWDLALRAGTAQSINPEQLFFFNDLHCSGPKNLLHYLPSPVFLKQKRTETKCREDW